MINDLTIVGNVGKEPDIKMTQAGKKIVSFSMAFSKKDKDGKDKSTWINVNVFEGHTQFWVNEAAKVKKGDRVLVKGPIELESFIGKDGLEKSSLKMIGNSIVFMAKPEKPTLTALHQTISNHSFGTMGFDLPGIPF